MTPPTRLSRIGTKGLLKALAEERPVQIARASAPWSGILQDSTTGLYSAGNTFGNSELYGPETVFTTNLICRNEVLTWDYGWKRMQGPTAAKALPLGGSSATFPLTAVDASCNAIGALAYLPSIANTTTAGASVESNIAVTNYLAANGNGGLYYLNIAAGDWAAAAISGTDSAGNPCAGLTTNSTRRIDYTIYNLANNPINAARQASIIFCNGVGTGGRVWYYPNDRDGTTYTHLPLTNAAPYPNVHLFQAESVCTADERVIFLGTNENGISYPQRVRWTAQSWTAFTSTLIWNNKVDGGAGGLDLAEFGGKGLRILPQGDRVVCYFSDGIAVLEPTGRAVPAFTRRYVTRNRGLLGKGSVVDLGGGVHFGIFTDGFWLFSEANEWKEVGVLEVVGTRVYKWTDYFFSVLNRTQADRITMGYDPEHRLVYITFPDSGVLYQTWVYEVGADRMWLQDYTLGSNNQAGLAWGWLRSTEGPASVKMTLAHGSGNGFVWEHVPNLYQRDGNNVPWGLTTAVSDYGDPYSLKTLIADRYSYHNHGVAGTFATYGIYQGQTATLAFSYSTPITIPATTDERGVLMVPVHATGLSLRHEITGNHPLTIFGMQHEFVKNGDAL